MKENNINGPIFVSIGDPEKLEEFLKQNPKVPRDSIFVDDYNFDAYKKVGFKSFTETDDESKKQAKLAKPNLSFKQWMQYLGNVGKLSPIPSDMKFGDVPEGVLRLGGTFVVNGDDVLYQWSDRLPGDHPDIDEVLSIAIDAANKSGSSAPKKSFFGLSG